MSCECGRTHASVAERELRVFVTAGSHLASSETIKITDDFEALWRQAVKDLLLWETEEGRC